MKPTPVEQANRMRISCDVLKCFAANTWLTFQQGYVTVNAVLAQWELTPLEQAILEGAMRT